MEILDLPLIKCEIELELSWSRKCVVSTISETPAVAANQPSAAREATERTGATFQNLK